MNYHKLSMSLIPIEREGEFNALLKDNIEFLTQLNEVSN
jgi:hypothetical protein